MLKSIEFEPTEQDRLQLSRERFLTSHRAIAACSREFGRLAEEVVERGGALRLELGIEEQADLRLTPDRCILQLGQAALTIAWLRGPLDSLADGRLLVIAWHGTITRRRFSEVPERMNAPRAAQTAVSVWEETFTVVAEDEATWEWQSETDPTRRYGSADLAERALAQVRDAWRVRPTSAA